MRVFLACMCMHQRVYLLPMEDRSNASHLRLPLEPKNTSEGPRVAMKCHHLKLAVLKGKVKIYIVKRTLWM